MLLKNCFWDIILNNGFLLLHLYRDKVVKVAFLGKKMMLSFIVKPYFCEDLPVIMSWQETFSVYVFNIFRTNSFREFDSLI